MVQFVAPSRDSGQCGEQSRGLWQVSDIKALGEPAIDLRQQLSGGIPLALALPQTTQAYRSPQFQRLRLLVTTAI
jgi:hypothetical protein